MVGVPSIPNKSQQLLFIIRIRECRLKINILFNTNYTHHLLGFFCNIFSCSDRQRTRVYFEKVLTKHLIVLSRVYLLKKK